MIKNGTKNKTFSFKLDKGTYLLWFFSSTVIIVSFFLFEGSNYLSLLASLVGATSLVYCAKGNPVGQILMIAFSIIYGIISYTFAYYGEMITYLGMTLPMAVFSLVSWLKNPYQGNNSEVKVNKISVKEIFLSFFAALFITLGFYFILKALNTANLAVSTVSVATSFFAAYYTFRRSPLYALFYALNDVVLIILWTLATLSSITYLSVLICFAMFLINDVYGFVSWLKMAKRQTESRT